MSLYLSAQPYYVEKQCSDQSDPGILPDDLQWLFVVCHVVSFIGHVAGVCGSSFDITFSASPEDP